MYLIVLYCVFRSHITDKNHKGMMKYIKKNVHPLVNIEYNEYVFIDKLTL